MEGCRQRGQALIGVLNSGYYWMFSSQELLAAKPLNVKQWML